MTIKQYTMKKLINRKGINWAQLLIYGVLGSGLFFSGLTSCTFDTNEFKPIVVPDTVSFMNDIVEPIFAPKCAYSGCHSDNGIPPILITEKAYNSLQKGSINLNEPENSLLYKKINTGGSMAIYASDQDRQIIITWIEQGAPNN